VTPVLSTLTSTSAERWQPPPLPNIELLGEGSDKAAYYWKGFVIKPNVFEASCHKRPSAAELAPYGVRLAKQVNIGGWCVQEYAIPLTQVPEHEWPQEFWPFYREFRDGYHDFHCSNVGIGADYKLVVFDW
jgi:hypothetical protein